MKRMLVAAVMIAGTVAWLWGQNFTVAYTEGTVELEAGPSWQALVIGDPLSSSATIRLGEGSYLEIAGGYAKVSLSAKGVYRLDRLLSETTQISSAGAGQALSAGLAALFGAPAASSGSMGIRSEKAGEKGGVSWISSESQVYLDAGKENLKSKNYEAAIGELKRALGSASRDELPEVRYYLGYAYSLSGNTREALKTIAGLEPGDAGALAADLVILKGKLLVDTSAFRQDVEWLTKNEAAVSLDVQREPLYYLMLGISYGGVGATTEARANLEKVVAMAGDSAVGEAAGRLLEQR